VLSRQCFARAGWVNRLRSLWFFTFAWAKVKMPSARIFFDRK
jgi:hypothetical protein